MNPIIHILHIEDNPKDAELVQAKLEGTGLLCRITRIQTFDEFNAALKRDEPDIILADYRLPMCDGMSALRLAKELRPEVPFIFVSGTKGEEAAIETLTQGATDYVLKHNMERLEFAVKRALREAKNRREHKQAEETYRIGTGHFEELFNKAAIPLCFVNKEGSRLIFNTRFERTFGYSQDEVPTLEKWWQLAYPDPDYRKWVIDTCYKELERAAEANTDIEPIEYRVTCKNGDIRTMAVFGSFIGKDLLLTFFDITERKQAEQQIALMSFAMNGIHEAAFMIDENARFLYVNEEACRILGYTRNELLTMGIPDISPGFRTERWLGWWGGIKKQGTRTFEREFKARDGSIFPVEINAYYFEYEGLSFALGLVRDITERKQAERECLANLRIFESMDRINQAIQGAKDLEQMMSDVLDVVQDIFDCDRTFLLYPCDPESQTWTCPMERNRPEYPGVHELGLVIPMDPQVAETLRTVLASDGPVTFGPGSSHPLPEDKSKQFGFRSLLSMALCPKTGSPWQFGIHQCSHARVWTDEEKRLFKAIGRRLTDSLSILLGYRHLQESEERFRLIAENTADTISIFDLNLKQIYTSPSVLKLRGYTVQEAITQSLDQILTPESLQKVKKLFAKQVALEKSGKADPARTTLLELEEYRKDGSTIWVELAASTLRDNNLKPTGILTVSRDITERKQAEESIRKLSQAIEQSPVSIVITDTEGSIEFVNAKFTQITGYSYNEAIGQNPRILKSGETSDEGYRRLWETISSGCVWEGEFHNRKKNGELFWEHATIAPVRNTDNVITHYVAVKEDIAERKKLEEQFRQTQKMEAVGQLAGGVAHDFNNMLGVIIGCAEIALEDKAQDASQRKNLEEILAAGHRSAEITRKLLAFARKQTISPKILDLNDTVEKMLKLLRRLIGEDIDVVWAPGANLWPVKIDPAQIDQILANLCVNAKDAITEAGKITIETQNRKLDDLYCDKHREFSAGEYIILAVSDNGNGMDKGTMDKIFEPFFTTKGMGRGTGLGLSTVYGIVKQNSGFINVYSEPGHGSTFKIYLPRHAVKTEQIWKKSPMTPTARGQETILLVEDESSVLNIVKLMLEKLGYVVMTSSTPGEAIRIASENDAEINMLITDVVMPEMRGRDLAKNLNSFYPELKCLFMSGYIGNALDEHGVLDESVNFIQKPFSKQDLAIKVREVLDSKP